MQPSIEAGLVLSQFWAERQRTIMIIVPANLRKQWHQTLQDKFALEARILQSKNHNRLRKQVVANPFFENAGSAVDWCRIRGAAS